MQPSDTSPAPDGGRVALPLFDRLHIEPLVREWCAGVGSEPHMPTHLVDGLVNVLRKRLARTEFSTEWAERVVRHVEALLEHDLKDSVRQHVVGMFGVAHPRPFLNAPQDRDASPTMSPSGPAAATSTAAVTAGMRNGSERLSQAIHDNTDLSAKLSKALRDLAEAEQRYEAAETDLTRTAVEQGGRE